MKQRHIVTALAIFAVTGAVSVPNSHVTARGAESAPVLYAQLATGVPPEIQLQYHYISREQLSNIELSQIDGKGGGVHYGVKDASTSSSEAGTAETQSYGNYFPTGQSSLSTTGGHEYLSGVPTTPSADPLVRDLSLGSSPR